MSVDVSDFLLRLCSLGFAYKTDSQGFFYSLELGADETLPCPSHVWLPQALLQGSPLTPTHYFCSASQIWRQPWSQWYVTTHLCYWYINGRYYRASSLWALRPCRPLIQLPMPHNASCGSGFTYSSSTYQTNYTIRKKTYAINPGDRCRPVA